MKLTHSAMGMVGFVFLLSVGQPTRADDDPMALRSQPPTAKFELNDGWLKICVKDSDKPRNGISITCIVGLTVWAEGQTDSNGYGVFPVPKAEWCQIVFDLGAGPSAPVPLTFMKNGSVVPVEAPILDGTAECCIIPESNLDVPETPSMLTSDEWRVLSVVISFFIFLIAGVYYMLFFRFRSVSTKSTKSRRKSA